MGSQSSALRLQKNISGQFCTLFRLWFRVGHLPPTQTHRHSHHLTDNLRLLRVFQRANRYRRQGMRLQNDSVATDVAPATYKAVAGLDKIDRALKLGSPDTL